MQQEGFVFISHRGGSHITMKHINGKSTAVALQLWTCHLCACTAWHNDEEAKTGFIVAMWLEECGYNDDEIQSLIDLMG